MLPAKRWLGLTVVLCVFPTLTGCWSNNRIVSSNTVQANNWFGELGITGHNNEITLKAGTDLEKLSVLGNGNRVRVEPRCTLGKIEVWGAECTVYVPQYMVIRKHIVGNNSQIIPYDPFSDQPLPSGPDAQWIETLPGDTSGSTGASPAGSAPPPNVSPANPMTPSNAPPAGVIEPMPSDG